MHLLKLIKGLSYAGSVYATKDQPLVAVEDDAAAAAAIASGYFEAVDEAAPAPADPILDDGDKGQEDKKPDDESGKEEQPKDIHKMTEKELRAYAEERQIDLEGCTTKKEVLKKVEEYEAGMEAAAALLGQDN